jgi:hypothetical protein
VLVAEHHATKHSVLVRQWCLEASCKCELSSSSSRACKAWHALCIVAAHAYAIMHVEFGMKLGGP